MFQNQIQTFQMRVSLKGSAAYSKLRQTLYNLICYLFFFFVVTTDIKSAIHVDIVINR